MASRIDRLRLLDRFRKKLTVMGIMGHTQGVSRANSPPTNPEKKRNHNDVSVVVVVSPRACSLSMTGVHKSVVVVCAVGVVAVVTSFEVGLAVSAVFSAGWATFCFGSLFFFQPVLPILSLPLFWVLLLRRLLPNRLPRDLFP